MTNLEIRPATRTDIATATRLLDAAGLPVDDIDRKETGAFLAAVVGDTLRSTEEFAGLCFDDAVLMSKRL